MATMNISLPDKMKEWVESRVESGEFSNASDFVRDLLRREQKKQEYLAYIQQAVDEGIASGFSETTVDEILNDMEAAAEAAVALRKTA